MRAKRGPDHKAIKGADGKNVMEEAVVEKKNFTKRFVVRLVKHNVAYGALRLLLMVLLLRVLL